MWKIITDDNIRHAWECEECHDIAIVTPDWYDGNGTPYCVECECNMSYEHTQVNCNE